MIDVTEAQHILYTLIVDDIERLYDKIVDAKLSGCSPGLILSAMVTGTITRREGCPALHKIIEALQHVRDDDGKGSDS